MEDWEKKFEEWVKRDRDLSDITIKNYIYAITRTAQRLDFNISEIESEEDFIQFYEKATIDSEVLKWNAQNNSRHTASLQMFRDFIISITGSSEKERKEMKKHNSGTYASESNKKQLGKHSWHIIDKNTIVKKTDLSFFKYHGSIIPKDMMSFFDFKKIGHDGKRHLSLHFEGNYYRGSISTEKSNYDRTKIYWTTELSKRFNSLYQYSETNSENSPYLKFENAGPDTYNLSLIDHKHANFQKEITFDEKKAGVMSIYSDEVKNVKGMKEGSVEQVTVNRYERREC